MRGKTILSVVALGWLAGCVPPPQSAVPTPPAPPEAEADAGPPLRETMEGKPLPRVDVRLLKCSTLNSATDDDKAYAATFMLGYRSALMGSHIIDTKRIDAVEQTALADCATHPEASATRVFAVALFKVEHVERLEKAAERAEKAAQSAAERAGMTPPIQFRRRAVLTNPPPAPTEPQAPAPTSAGQQAPTPASTEQQAPASASAGQPAPASAPPEQQAPAPATAGQEQPAAGPPSDQSQKQ